VIVEGGGEGDRVYRCPIVGNETVLDAVSQVNGLRELSTKEIFIARPEPAGARQDKVLPVNWQEIARGASTVTNYQVFPGDRIFIVDRPTGSPATN